MKHRFTCILACLGFLLPIAAQPKPSRQWLDQKYSMFIHFGLYSVYGGVYDGKPVEQGYSEQIQSFAGIFSDWYAETAKQFNPVKWNPDSIVALAKEAGMKSIVFTSKHHDGFCMYHSKYTGFNVVDATPYGKDIMKELAEACARGGIGFSVYFSLIDWHFPQAYPISSHNADPLTPEHYAFNLKQVEEIMTGYGPISEIWFDMGSLIPGQSKGLYDLVNRLQPQCMVSGRLGNDFVDFSVMGDNEYPDYKIGVPWQTAASVFPETWGYRSWQKRAHLQEKINEKIGSLVRVISRGGNFLLNIGPRGDGSVVEYERDVLLGIGKWIKANSEAIYATGANPFEQPFVWGDITTKDNNLYLFVKRAFEGKSIGLPQLENAEINVIDLISGKTCAETRIGKGNKSAWRISVPEPDGEYPFIVLKLQTPDEIAIVPATIFSGNIPLTPENASAEFGHSSFDYYCGYKSLTTYRWAFASSKKEVVPEFSFTDNEKGKSIVVEVNGQRQIVTLDGTTPEVKKVNRNRVKWGSLYWKRGRGVFGTLDEENERTISVDSVWQLVPGFIYGETREMPLRQRGSVLFLQEIESSSTQTAAVEIGGGDGVYVLLNGKYVTAHFSRSDGEIGKEIVLLPLQKGKNQLTVKYFNRYEKGLKYSIKPLWEWNVYTQRAAAMPLSETTGRHDNLTVRLANPASKVSPAGLNNLSIKLK